MKRLNVRNNTKNRLLYALCFFLVLTTNMGCGSFQNIGGTTTTNYVTNCSLSRLEGQTNKYFSSRIIVTSNFITDLRIISVEGLPPGVYLNKSRRTLEGTPTLAGFYNITILYNDRYKGAPGGIDWRWTYNGEISIYDKLN